MPERGITLRYPGTCRLCGRTLPKETRARWDPTTKLIACVQCPAAAAHRTASADVAATPVARTSPALRAPARPAQPLASGVAGWRQLLSYHLLAAQRASVAEPVAVTGPATWVSLDLAQEHVVTGRADTVTVDARLAGLFADVKPDEVVYYGWPLIVTRDRNGRLRAAPLLMTALDAPSAEEPGIAFAIDDSPYVNPALLTDRYFPADALAAANACIPEELPFGDVLGMRTVVVGMLEAVGFDASPLDPDALTRPGATMRAGVHNVAMAFRGPSDRATRGLIQELSELRGRDDWQHTAAAWLVAPPRWVADSGQPDAEDSRRPHGPDRAGRAAPLSSLSVEGLRLNDSQEQAVEAALTQPLTVVTGPPGTGKSQLVAAVVANQWIAGRSVLVASTNNGAVDVALERCARVDPALLLRTGKREIRDELPAALDALAGRDATAAASRDVIQRHLEVAEAGRSELLRRLTARTSLEAELARVVLDLEQLRRLLWGTPGRSPVHDRRDEVHRAARKLSRSRWLRNWRARRLFDAAAPTTPGVRADDIVTWSAAEARADALTAELDRLGPADPDRERREVGAADAAWAQAGTAALRDIVSERLHAGRAVLQQLAQLGRARTGGQRARVEAIVRTLPYTPGWACTTLSAQANFPLRAGTFDLLVVDEASQCSIAQLIPLAYRARRVLVVGDPNQLTPIVSFGPAVLQDLAASVGTSDVHAKQVCLSVGSDSAFTAYAARSSTTPLLLNEHYRCHPAIARWFNDRFYDGALRVLTSVDAADDRLRGLSLLDVRGRTERGETGGAYNRDEADAIATWVLQRSGDLGSVGVVTPFAAQADLVRTRLGDVLGEASQKIAVGTAHRFQGDERDIILFSATLAEGARASTAGWVESQRNLINVAVSRARQALVVVADTRAVARLAVPTLKALVDAAGSAAGPNDLGVDGGTVKETLREDATLHSEAERRLYEALRRTGVHAEPKAIVEGYELDFAISTPAGRLNVEVDGIHHTDARGRQRRQDLTRDHIIQRLGWHVVRFPAWRCLAEPEQVAADVKRRSHVGEVFG